MVIERLSRFGGGVEAAAFQLLRELGSRGIDVSVVCHRIEDAPPTGVRVLALRIPARWQPLRLLAFSQRAARATRGFDVVHAYSRTRKQDLYRTGGGSHADYMERAYPRPRLRRLFSPRHRAILAIEEAVFRDPSQLLQCNANRTATEITERYGVDPKRIAVVYNGVDTERFHPEKSARAREGMRRELGLEGPAALFAGNGFRRKGLDRAIEALARSRGRATLLVAGADDPAPYRRLASARGIAERVRFLGHRADVEMLYAAADLLLLPTRYDAFANVCLEAMAAGLPVATTPTNGASELIRHGENGLVLERDWAPAWALLEEPERCASFAAAAHETAAAHTWSRHADQVLALYARITEARRGAQPA